MQSRVRTLLWSLFGNCQVFAFSRRAFAVLPRLDCPRHWRSVPPSTSRVAAAAHPPAPAHALRTRSGGTRRCPSRCSVIIGAHTGTAWASHWLPCSQVRERATTENGLAGLARVPGATAPTPPTFAAWPTLLMLQRRTLLRFGHRRAGRAGRPRCRRVSRWTWI